ncbi:hypothetical protein CRG98_018849 [Punica granatum]|uniref:Uncharacterized protein n=1 Tax=Punica granatum TaxID=22663 RepID=A0A2I0JZ95_PUNGR|nr:hypothetical protein CRG98_018849 [Punica granatum]
MERGKNKPSSHHNTIFMDLPSHPCPITLIADSDPDPDPDQPAAIPRGRPALCCSSLSWRPLPHGCSAHGRLGPGPLPLPTDTRHLSRGVCVPIPSDRIPAAPSSIPEPVLRPHLLPLRQPVGLSAPSPTVCSLLLLYHHWTGLILIHGRFLY